ncbi:MAG: inositol monophosphatase family protein [Bdellovibrionales bacterium]
MVVEWEREAELALKSVSKTSEILMGGLDVSKIDLKGDHKDIVTEHDVLCEKIILDVLKDSPIQAISEESAPSPQSIHDLFESSCWLVDPIDGTTNFSSSMPLYASSVGLVVKGQFVVGAVSVPPQREIFFTYGNQGSFLNGKRMHIKDRALKSASIVASFSNSKTFKEVRQREYTLFGKVNESARTALRLGSAAVNICYTACGRLHGAYGFNAQLWDIAGGLAVASQAGCKIYTRIHPKSFTIDYIVGTPTVATELNALFQDEGVYNE